MNYRDYQNSRDASWDILLENNVRSLPVKVTEICKRMGIAAFSYQKGAALIERLGLTPHTRKTDGFTLIHDKEPTIFYNEQCTLARCRFTIAHELGHVILGHLHEGQVTAINREPTSDDDTHEVAANVFASRLLAPACVLWALHIEHTVEIATLCEISKQAAAFRAERMQLLYRREQLFLHERGKSCFLLSEKERHVYRQFKSFVDTHRSD